MDRCRVSSEKGDVRRFRIERSEERIAPSVIGTGGYDGRPGNQSNAPHNPSGSANPENSAS